MATRKIVPRATNEGGLGTAAKVWASIYTTFINAITHVLTPAPADHSVSGITIPLSANETQAIGDICRIDTDGQARIAKADTIANSGALVMCADATINADATGTYLLQGVARDDTWNWTVGGLVYLSVTGTTGNTLTQTAPSGTNNVIQVVGVATHADRMFFNPQLIQVEHT